MKENEKRCIKADVNADVVLGIMSDTLDCDIYSLLYARRTHRIIVLSDCTFQILNELKGVKENG